MSVSNLIGPGSPKEKSPGTVGFRGSVSRSFRTLGARGRSPSPGTPPGKLEAEDRVRVRRRSKHREIRYQRGRHLSIERTKPDPVYARIYRVVKRIPRGRVATYGQIAELAGIAGHARQVGYALHALRDGDAVPWQRVVNARGEVSPRAEPGGDRVQRAILEAEGVVFDTNGRIELTRHRWRPRVRRSRAAP